jgi:hypothetical protein
MLSLMKKIEHSSSQLKAKLTTFLSERFGNCGLPTHWRRRTQRLHVPRSFTKRNSSKRARGLLGAWHPSNERNQDLHESRRRGGRYRVVGVSLPMLRAGALVGGELRFFTNRHFPDWQQLGPPLGLKVTQRRLFMQFTGSRMDSIPHKTDTVVTNRELLQ